MFINMFKKLFFRHKSTNMEAEIFEQPQIISKLIKKYITKDGKVNIDLPDNTNKIALIASGSSYHSATIAANYLRNYVHCEAQSYYASEFSLVENVNPDPETLYILISQSGETADTNNALKKIAAKTNKIMAITNTKDSTLYNGAKYKILTNAGAEKSIASTKAMSAQMFCLFLIAAKIMQQKEIPVDKTICELKNAVSSIEKAFSYRDIIKKYSLKLKDYDNAAVLASGMFYPLAKEGALKIKETSYINTTAYPTGEFLHGHIAILNKRCAVISVINNYNTDFMQSVIANIRKNYNTDLLIISANPVKYNDHDTLIQVSTMFDIDFIFTTLVIFQLMALETASLLNRNVDKPEGLTKIVK